MATDLSHLAEDRMVPTAQLAAGNMISDPERAMTAPGSPAAVPAAVHDGPHVIPSGPQIPVSHTGKPPPRAGELPAGTSAWKKA